MTPELKTKWVEALRSGKYVQGRGKLYRAATQSYCCLGVLCHLTGQPTEGGYLTESQVNILGLPTNYEGTKDQFVLSAMNDDGASFNEIADFIEENL